MIPGTFCSYHVFPASEVQYLAQHTHILKKRINGSSLNETNLNFQDRSQTSSCRLLRLPTFRNSLLPPDSGFKQYNNFLYQNSKREHTAIMEHYNLNCKCLQYRHPKKQNLSLTTSNQETSNLKKKKKARVTWELCNCNSGNDNHSILLKYDYWDQGFGTACCLFFVVNAVQVFLAQFTSNLKTWRSQIIIIWILNVCITNTQKNTFPSKKIMNWKQELRKTKRWLQNARFVVLMKTEIFWKMTQCRMPHRYRRSGNRFQPQWKRKSKHLDLPLEHTFQGSYIMTGGGGGSSLLVH